MGSVDIGAKETADALVVLMHNIVREYVGGFLNSNGQIDFSKAGGFVNRLPPTRGGVPRSGFAPQDHNHDGTGTNGQQLDALNTHMNAVLGPATGAIHWEASALQALIAANGGSSFDPATTTIPAGTYSPSGTLEGLLDELFRRLNEQSVAIGGYGLQPYGTSSYGG